MQNSMVFNDTIEDTTQKIISYGIKASYAFLLGNSNCETFWRVHMYHIDKRHKQWPDQFYIPDSNSLEIPLLELIL